MAARMRWGAVVGALVVGLCAVQPAQAQDLTTLLARFLQDLYAGVIGSTAPINGIRNGDGSSTAPSYSFASDTNSGWYSSGDNQLMAAVGGANTLHLTSTDAVLAATRALQWGSSGVQTPDVSLSRGAANVLTLASGDFFQMGGVAFASLGTPSNGTFVYCSDCTIAATCAGAGTGALAKRLNGAWVCN